MNFTGKCILVILAIALLSLSLPANAPVFADSGISSDTPALQESQTVEVTLLGPNQYIRTSGQPNVYTDEFPGVEGIGKLIIQNGHESGESRVSSAVVTVNEARVLSPKDFNLEVGCLETTIDLHEQNEIVIELRSTEESFVTVSIIQEIEAEAAAVIGPGGGSVEVTDPESPIFGARLTVPNGAMNDTVVLSLSLGIVVDDPGFVGIPVLCNPHGYQFNNDIEFTIPLQEPSPSDNLLMLMVYNAATDTYEYDGRLIVVNSGDTHASANIDHFSSFWLLDIFDNPASLDVVVDQAPMLLAIGIAYQTGNVVALKWLRQELIEQNLEYLDTMYSIVEVHNWCLNVINFDWFIQNVYNEIYITGAIYSGGMISSLMTGMPLAEATGVFLAFTKAVSIAVLGVLDYCFLSTSFASPAFRNAYAGFVLTELEVLLIDEILPYVELLYDDGGVECGWASSSSLHGAAVLFTPPTSPWTLSSIEVQGWYDGDDAPFYVEIWDENCNELFRGTYMYSDYFNTGVEWPEIDIPDIEVTDDFYVCVFPNDVWLELWIPIHALWMFFDNDLPYSGRSYCAFYDTNTLDGGPLTWDWMIRAVGHP